MSTIRRQTYKYPYPPDLPESRLKSGFSFENVGIDYAGPVFVTDVYSHNNELFKAWIALITCQTSRAVYLDLATNYSGLSCINVLRRFFRSTWYSQINHIRIRQWEYVLVPTFKHLLQLKI